MKLQTAFKKLEQAGATIEEKNERMYVAKFANDSIEFINDDGDVSNWYVIGNKQSDDITTDYFAGRFARNLKHALEIVEARK
jgi:hypothetical protein